MPRHWALALALASLPLTAAAPAQADCRSAGALVWQQPVAEGTTNLRDLLTGVLLIQSVRPSTIEGWQYSGQPPQCTVTFRYSQDGTPTTLSYQVDTHTRTVEPADAVTRESSGY